MNVRINRRKCKNLRWLLGVVVFFAFIPNILNAQSATINVYIDLDNYESETTWTLTGPSGSIGSGGPYANDDEVIDQDFVVTESGNYAFTIDDSYGDGISVNGTSDTNNSASYSISVDGTPEFQSSGYPNFGSQDIFNFTISLAPLCPNEYTFDWYNSSTGQGNEWPVTNGETSYYQNYALTGPLGNIGLTVELDNGDLQNIDYSNQGDDGGPNWLYTATNGQAANQATYGDDYLTFGVTADNVSQETSFTFTFDEPIDLTDWEISDIDYTGSGTNLQTYQDEVFVTAINSGTPVTLTYSNVGSGINATGNNTTLLTLRADYTAGVNGNVDPDAAEGMVFISTNDYITSFTVTYSNGPSDDGQSDDQGVRVDGFNFCPERTYNYPTIGDRVWEDTDEDGIQDAGEIGLSGVVVYLYESGGTPFDNTITDVNGNYTFTNVPVGDYYLDFILPNGYVFSPQDATGDTQDSDANTTTGQTAVTTLVGDEDDISWDAGMYQPVINHPDCNYLYAVADAGDILVYMSRDGSAGAITIGSNNVANIEAIALSLDAQTLYAANANQLGTLNWNTGNFTALASNFGTGGGESGEVTFSDVDGLAFDPLSGILYGTHRWTDGSPEDILIQINPSTGAHVPNAFGTDIDYVVIDTFDEVGLYDIDDIAISPVDGQMYGVINSSGGSDRIAKINKYTGDVEDVGRSHTSTANVDDVEGLAFHNSGTFYGVTGTSPETMYEIDVTDALFTLVHTMDNSGDYESVAGLTCGSNLITGTVFIDSDEDGIFDGGESGQSGVTVKLYRDVNNDGLVDGGDVFAHELVTDANGEYEFEVGTDGAFVLEIDETTLPGGAVMSTDNREESDFVNWGNTDPNNDFGYYIPNSCPGNLVSNPGFELDLADWTIGSGKAAITTDAAIGSKAILATGLAVVYQDQPAQAGYTYSLSVWGKKSFTDYTYAGMLFMDASSQQLYDAQLEITSVGSYQQYSMDYIAPSGTVTVRVYFYTSDNSSNEVTVDEYCLTEALDLGSIGDYIWNDENADGVQDGGEPGMDNVTVELYRDNNNDGIVDGGDTYIGQSTTSGGGLYDFSGIDAGDYLVVVTDDNNVLTNYNLTGGTDPHDVTLSAGQDYNNADFGYYDYDPTGYIYDEATGEIISGGSINVAGPGVVTIVQDGSNGYYEFYTDGTAGTYTIILTVPSGYDVSTTCLPSDPPAFDPTGGPNPTTLGSGEAGSTGYLEDFTCGNNTFYYTFDLAPADPEILHNNFPLYNLNTASIGDYVWLDDNLDGVQNDGATGIENVRVILFDGTSTQIDETLTDANGWYQFANLPPDNYTVFIDEVTLPSELDLQTYDYDGLLTQHNADITLGLGETNNDLDFGYGINPLPVTLSGFMGQIDGNKIKLTWTTQSEVQNQGFFIDRRLEGEEDWQELTNFIDNPGLRGQGSSTHKAEYEYIDSTATSGFIYEYRLGDVDYNTAKYFHNNRIIRIEVEYTAIPEKFSLQPAYPNPFNPITTISYSLPEICHARLNIYDISGNLVRKLVNRVENPGIKNVIWNSRNERGEEVPSGMYIYTLQAGSFKESNKLLLIR